jgi:hypothetical protein
LRSGIGKRGRLNLRVLRGFDPIFPAGLLILSAGAASRSRLSVR